MGESSQPIGTESNPWVEFDTSPVDRRRSAWSIVAWPFVKMPSSAERRLVFYNGATAEVRPAGRHTVPLSEALTRLQSTRNRPVFRIGWVTMTPSVRELSVASIWSGDSIEFTATFSFVLTPKNVDAAIVRLACGGSEEEKRVVNALQRAAQVVLVGMNADEILDSLATVFSRLQEEIHKGFAALALPFDVLEPRLESCCPTDPKIALASIERQRLRAEARLEGERTKVRDAQLEKERREKQAELRLGDLEAGATIQRERDKAGAEKGILTDRANAEAERDRIKAAVLAATQKATQEMQIEIDKQRARADVEHERAKAEALADKERVVEEMRIQIAELRKQLVQTPEGMTALFPQQAFDLEKEKLKHSTWMMKELRAFEAQGMFTGGQVNLLQRMFAPDLNITNQAGPRAAVPLVDSTGEPIQGNGEAAPVPDREAPANEQANQDEGTKG